ncbi:MAG: hypothetical protein JWL72_2122 [Ilumatobacteraceae bacterium]|nr:hypothetical protein [Ilumatobacteraceae bacterium]MCU1388784.1 hypothetical protein [Ilumatobacteraceae bacterium]
MTWKVLWDAIALPDPPPGTGAMVALGLDGIRVGYKGDPTSTYHGRRHGRWVQIRQTRAGRGTVMVVWVGAMAPPLAITPDDGRLVAASGPPVVGALVARLGQNRVWNDVECRGGPDGIVTRRPVGSRFPQGWMYDLWLAEAIAQAVGAPALADFGGDPAGWQVPV